MRRKYYSAKRRRLMARGEKIDHLQVFERDGWICGICNAPINKFLRQPNWKAATVDHIIPLSKGGTHTYENCQASHAQCNFDKGNLTPLVD